MNGIGIGIEIEMARFHIGAWEWRVYLFVLHGVVKCDCVMLT